MVSYYVIYYEKFRKFMQQTEKVCFNIVDDYFRHHTLQHPVRYAFKDMTTSP